MMVSGILRKYSLKHRDDHRHENRGGAEGSESCSSVLSSILVFFYSLSSRSSCELLAAVLGLSAFLCSSETHALKRGPYPMTLMDRWR